MVIIPPATVIKVPLWLGQETAEFAVSFSNAMIKVPAKGDNSGTRCITICVMQCPLLVSSPWSGVAILHPNDLHSQETGNRLAFKRAVMDFCNRQNFRQDEKKTWDLFRKAFWKASVGKYMPPGYQK